MNTNYYELLELQPQATAEAITAAYHRKRAHILASESENETNGQTLLKELEEAYEVLRDPERRAAYDRSQQLSVQASAIVPAKPGIWELVKPLGEEPPPTILCPHCGMRNPAKAAVCVNCGQQMARACPYCGASVRIDEVSCSRCGTVLHEYSLRRMAEALVTKDQVQRERAESEAQVRILEEGNAIRGRQALAFWILVLLLCIALVVLSAVVRGCVVLIG